MPSFLLPWLGKLYLPLLFKDLWLGTFNFILVFPPLSVGSLLPLKCRFPTGFADIPSPQAFEWPCIEGLPTRLPPEVSFTLPRRRREVLQDFPHLSESLWIPDRSHRRLVQITDRSYSQWMISSNDVSSNDISSNGISSNDVTANDISSDDVSVNVSIHRTSQRRQKIFLHSYALRGPSRWDYSCIICRFLALTAPLFCWRSSHCFRRTSLVVYLSIFQRTKDSGNLWFLPESWGFCPLDPTIHPHLKQRWVRYHY